VGSSLTMRTVGGSEKQARLLRAGDYLDAVGQYGLFGCSSHRCDASRPCRREAWRPAVVMKVQGPHRPRRAPRFRSGPSRHPTGHPRRGLRGCGGALGGARRRRDAWGLTSIGWRYALLGGSVRWLTGADGRQHVAEVVAGEGCAGERHAGACWILRAPQTASTVADPSTIQPLSCRMNHACEER
jgi:hypothetical protein